MAAIRTDPTARLTAAGGSILINGAFSGKEIKSFIAQEDTTFSVLNGFDQNNIAIDWKTVLNCASIKAGALFILPDHCYIASGTISGGSIIGYS